MKFKEFKKLINKIDAKKHGDSEVFIDTEAAQYTCHLVDPTRIGTECSRSDEEDVVVISLNDNAKLHLSDEEFQHLRSLLGKNDEKNDEEERDD